MFLVVLGLNVFLSLGISLGMHVLLRAQYFAQFKESKLALARALARAVDGAAHDRFRSLDSLQDPYYQRLLSYFRGIREQHPEIVYLYSLSYDTEQEVLLYGVDATDVPTDTVWIESEPVSFYINRVTDDSLHLVYNERDQSDSFMALNGARIEYDPGDRLIEIDGVPLLRISQSSPLRLEILAADAKGVQVHAQNRIVSFKENMEFQGGESVEWSLSFSAAGDPGSDPGSEYVDDEESVRLLLEQIQTGNDLVEDQLRVTSYGEYISARAVIRNAGQVSGLLALDISVVAIEEFNRSLAFLSLGVFLVALLLSFALAIFLTRFINRPINALSQAVAAFGRGDLSVPVAWHSPDEFGQLALSMTAMAGSLEAARSHILRINEASRKFVPQDFLHFLNREDLTQIRLGDQVEASLSILFSDIRSFTSISEAMSPEENFRFINDYLKTMGPRIRDHSGFIDKYIGDAIMALFPQAAEDAVASAISMQQAMNHYNESWDVNRFGRLRIGVGIHTGRMMLGIVGEEMRMDSTVISDAVNIAARLESLSKSYGCRILISSVTYNELQPAQREDCRYLGPMPIRGKSSEVQIYEVFSADSDSMRSWKLASRNRFEAAVQAMAEGNNLAAVTLFGALAKEMPADRTINALLARSQA